MTNVRDSNVLHAVDILGDIPLRVVAKGLYDAVLEAEAEGVTDISRDPAIMVFGAFVAFHTHTDIATPSDYRAAVERCAERFNQPQVMQ